MNIYIKKIIELFYVYKSLITLNLNRMYQNKSHVRIMTRRFFNTLKNKSLEVVLRILLEFKKDDRLG